MKHECWGVLQCVVLCCRVLQCVAVCCSVLQCVAVCAKNQVDTIQRMYKWYDAWVLYGVLQHDWCVAVCCSALQCVAVWGSILCVAAWLVCCSALQCVAVCCSVLQFVAVYCVLQHDYIVCCSMTHASHHSYKWYEAWVLMSHVIHMCQHICVESWFRSHNQDSIRYHSTQVICDMKHDST